MAANALWEMIFVPASRIIVMSKKEDTAMKMLDDMKSMYTNLPHFLRPEIGSDQRAYFSFPKLNSSIRALATTKDTGIGFGQASLIIADEWDFHDEARRNYAEIKPMIDMGQGRFIALSAPNKWDITTKFKEIWYAAKAGDNNFHPIFFAYDVIPGRDEAWYKQQKKEYDVWDLEGRYPRNEAEALAAPQLVCKFDVMALGKMQERARFLDVKAEQAGITIYQKPVPGNTYVLVLDPSDGKEDPCCGIVVDVQTKVRVAGFNGKLTVDEQAMKMKVLNDMYFDPLTAVEINRTVGVLVLERLQRMGLWNLHMHAEDRPGWHTNPYTRGVMINELAMCVLNQSFVEPSEYAISEFNTFIKTKKMKDGEARGGCHDEYVICWAIALQLCKVANTGGMGCYSYTQGDKKKDALMEILHGRV